MLSIAKHMNRIKERFKKLLENQDFMAKKNIAALWSGGFDSTVMVYLLASKGYEVNPYHILIRNGGGKDTREKVAIDKIWELLKSRYPSVQKTIRIKHKIKACPDRNEKMIKYIHDEYGEKNIALGSYMEGSRYEKDNDKKYLSKSTSCNITTFNSFSINNKLEIASLIPTLELENIINLTWSCQLWWKNPCNRCFSCKERKIALESITY